jgi:hypothetical protein
MRKKPTHETTWRKSSFSGSSGTCVEIARVDEGVLVRNSTRPDDVTLAFTRSELAAFVAGCKAGEFDDLH